MVETKRKYFLKFHKFYFEKVDTLKKDIQKLKASLDMDKRIKMKEKSRFTLEMTTDEHMYLKMASAKLGISMREFLLIAAFERMEEIEDEWLAERARETLENIQLGKEKTISWSEMKKRIA